MQIRRLKPEKMFSKIKKNFSTTVLTRFVQPEDSEIIEKLFRGKHRVRYDLKKGDIRSNFKVQAIDHLKEFGISAYTLEHITTHARYIHLDSCDMNNCFAILLHTPPQNDKGIPLMAQRLAMCGTESFPIKEILSHMAEKRSMNTFSEPWSGPEFTVFPFSTTNEKDFQNLLGIYIESVFRPLNRRIDFLQEGVRLIYDSPEEQTNSSMKNDLSLAGTSYEDSLNQAQMPDHIFLTSIQKKIYQGSQYQYHGAGTPSQTRLTTYDEVVEYYNTHYSPHNASFFSYGDLDFLQQLEYIDSIVMKGKSFPKPSLQTPTTNTIQYVQDNILKCPPSADGSPIGMAAMTFKCNDIVDEPFETLALSVLSYCLFELPQSVFFSEFLNYGIAPAYCPGYGYDVTNRIATFTIGFAQLSNDPKELESICDRIMTTLKNIVEEGLDEETVNFALHYLEVNAREGKSDLGLNLLQNMIPFILHRGDPTNVLKIEDNFASLKKEISKGILENLIKKYFLDNTHGLRTIMTPDNLFSDTLRREEKQYLQQLQPNLTPQDCFALKQENETVMNEMCKLQDTGILPSLRIDDIVPLVESFEHEEINVGGIKVWLTEQETNGLSYLRFKFDITDIDPALLHFLELFCIVFPHLGSKGISSNQTDFLIDNYTSKFEMESHVFRDIASKSTGDASEKVNKILVLTVGYLDRNIEKVFGLLNDSLSTPDFSNLSRISELLQYYGGIYANNLAEKPMEMAISHANSGINYACFLNDKMKRTQDLCTIAINVLNTTGLKSELEKIAYHLKMIYSLMINKNKLSILVHTQKKNSKQIIKRLELLSATVNICQPSFSSSISQSDNLQSQQQSRAFKENYKRSITALPIRTNYIVESFKMPETLNNQTPVMHLAGEIMRNCIHFQEIRSVEGVFDAGCYIDTNGAFSIYSFRDHQSIQRYETFEKGIQYLTNKDFSEREIKEAKISLLARIDKNIEPFNKGLKWFLFGMHDRIRLTYRQAILASTSQAVVDTAGEILIQAIQNEKSSQVIFGSQQHNLQKLLSKGWEIERGIEGISVSPKTYKQNDSDSFVFNEIM